MSLASPQKPQSALELRSSVAVSDVFNMSEVVYSVRLLSLMSLLELLPESDWLQFSPMTVMTPV